MEVSVLRTFRAFPAMGQILWFGEEYEPGFTLWMWRLPKQEISSTCCYRKGAIPKLRTLVDKIDGALSQEDFAYRPGDKTWNLGPPRPVDGEVLHESTRDDLRLVFRPGRRSGPYFQLLRLTDDHPPLATSWYLKHHIQTLRDFIDEAEDWLGDRAHRPTAA